MASKEPPIPADAGTNGGPYCNPIGNVTADLVYDAGLKSARAFQQNVQRLMIVGIDLKTSAQAAHVSALIQNESKKFQREKRAAAAKKKRQEEADVGGVTPTAPWVDDWATPWAGYSVGIHPKYAQDSYDSTWADVAKMAREGVLMDPLFTAGGGGGQRKKLKPVAIGETGLDYFRSTGESFATQKKSLKAHVLLAQELGLPIILHVRDAYDDIFAHFAEWGITKLPGVLHCFSSDERHMRMGINLGLKISFCGTLTYPRSRALQHCVRTCPVDALVFETDAPWLPPQSCRGEANAPAFVKEVVTFAAQQRGEDPVALAAQAWKNSCQLFQIPTS